MHGAPLPEKPTPLSEHPMASQEWALLWAALVGFVLPVAIGQGSGALLPVHDEQRPGDHYDEVRLTVVLQSSGSYDR